MMTDLNNYIEESVHIDLLSSILACFPVQITLFFSFV